MKNRVPIAFDFPLYMEVKSITPSSGGMFDVEFSGLTGGFKTSVLATSLGGLSVGSVCLVRTSVFPLVRGLDYIPGWLEVLNAE